MGGTAAIIAAVVGAGTAVYSASEAKKQTSKALQKPTEPALPQEAKAPDAGVLKRQTQQALMPGGTTNSTLLTGPQGIDSSSLTLGKNALLGK